MKPVIDNFVPHIPTVFNILKLATTYARDFSFTKNDRALYPLTFKETFFSLRTNDETIKKNARVLRLISSKS